MEINKETIKAFCKIDQAIDKSFEKLSDRFLDLTLSHNRKKKALERILDKVSWEKRKHTELSLDWCFYSCLEKICNDALWSDGRERMKPFKKKGGKYAVEINT